MSDAFDIVPVPPEAEGLDMPFDPDAQPKKKYSCADGTYNGIVTKMEKATVKPGNEGKTPRLQFEVTLTDEAVKGIRCSRFCDLAGDFAWVIVKMVEAFGVKPVNGILPLKEKYHSIVAQPCRVKVKARTVGDRTYMDILEVLPPTPKEAPAF